MYSNAYQTVEINLKDLFFVIAKNIGIVLIAGFIIASAFFGYKYLTGANDANVLDVSVMLPGETEMSYSERVKNIERAEDIINSIDAINGQIDNQRDYMANSVLMQIDSMNEAVTTAQLVVTIEGDSTSGIDRAIVSSYSQDLQSGEYLANLADDLGTEQGYLTELITVEYAASNSVIINSEEGFGSAGTVTITVIGPTTDYTDKIMDQILEEVDLKLKEFNESTVAHTITLTGKQSFYTVDNDTRDLQYNAANRFESLQKQIINFNDSLGEVAAEIGVKDKDSLYRYFSFNDNSEVASSPRSTGSIKYSIIGFAIGAFIVLLILMMKYIFGRKFVSQASFFARFPSVNRIGVAKPSKKRSAYVRYIEKKSGDDSELSLENNIKLIAANIKNMTKGMNKVIITGTADGEKVKDFVARLGVNADVKASFFADPSCLEMLSNYDGIIIVEQRNYSDSKLIKEELELIANAGTKLVGAIVI